MPPETRSGGYRPGQREGTRSHSKVGSSSKNYKDSEKALDSRPNFDDSVVEAVYSAAPKSRNENGEITYKSAISGKFFTKDQTSIDHTIDWQSYCQDYCQQNDGLEPNGSLKRDVVKKAYNDLKNLRVVSKSENSSKGNRRATGNVLG